MRSLIVKAGATALTVMATVASAMYVNSHLKNPAAPLQPIVLTALPGGDVTLTPGVHPANVPPITSTYAS